jgi:hypothetical protein
MATKKATPQRIYGSNTTSTEAIGSNPTGIGILLIKVLIVGNAAKNTTLNTIATITEINVAIFFSYELWTPLKINTRLITMPIQIGKHTKR